jgi:hypothetical protein
MTSPVEQIIVACPACNSLYEDWYRASINLGLDGFDEDYVRRATTATCPKCGHVVVLDTLIVDGDVWQPPGAPTSPRPLVDPYPW